MARDTQVKQRATHVNGPMGPPPTLSIRIWVKRESERCPHLPSRSSHVEFKYNRGPCYYILITYFGNMLVIMTLPGRKNNPIFIISQQKEREKEKGTKKKKLKIYLILISQCFESNGIITIQHTILSNKLKKKK